MSLKTDFEESFYEELLEMLLGPLWQDFFRLLLAPLFFLISRTKQQFRKWLLLKSTALPLLEW
jgi:hypothetical protein